VSDLRTTVRQQARLIRQGTTAWSHPDIAEATDREAVELLRESLAETTELLARYVGRRHSVVLHAVALMYVLDVAARSKEPT
jgi:hypothetical protein